MAQWEQDRESWNGVSGRSWGQAVFALGRAAV
jgi:hypothetical protein